MSTPPVTPEPMTIQAPGQPEIPANTTPTVAPPEPPQPPTPESQAQPPAPPQEPEPFTESQTDGGFEIKLATGEVFKGKTEKEAYQNLAKSKVMTTLWAKGKGQLPDDETLRILRPDLFPTQQTPKQDDPPAPPEPADMAKVSEEILSGMVQNAPQAISTGVARYMGFETPEEMKQELTEMRQFVDQMKGEIAASQFLAAAPDFPNTKEAVAAISKVLGDIGAPWTPQNLQIAHAYCVKSGVYQPVAQQPPQTPQTQPPPMSPSGQHAPSTSAINPWDLNTSLDDLEKQWGR